MYHKIKQSAIWKLDAKETEHKGYILINFYSNLLRKVIC